MDWGLDDLLKKSGLLFEKRFGRVGGFGLKLEKETFPGRRLLLSEGLAGNWELKPPTLSLGGVAGGELGNFVAKLEFTLIEKILSGIGDGELPNSCFLFAGPVERKFLIGRRSGVGEGVGYAVGVIVNGNLG